MKKRIRNKKLKIKIQFYKPSDKLPERSCKVLASMKGNQMFDVQYSARHKAFNAGDEDIDPQHIIKVQYWAYMPKL